MHRQQNGDVQEWHIGDYGAIYYDRFREHENGLEHKTAEFVGGSRHTSYRKVIGALNIQAPRITLASRLVDH
jgi:hypothetical protein